MMCTYRPQWKKHQVELMRKTGFATIHAEMSCNTIESMAAMLEECRVHALSSGNVALLDKLELFLDDYKANPPELTAKSDVIGGFPEASGFCKGCGVPLHLSNAWMTDGCPCNSPLGVNSMNETRWRLLMQLQQEQSREIEKLKESLFIATHSMGTITHNSPRGQEETWQRLP